MNEIIINKEYSLVEIINLIIESGDKEITLKIEPESGWYNPRTQDQPRNASHRLQP